MSQAPHEFGLTVASVARRLGVAPDTLRTWDRRYGLGPSEHIQGQHRRYSQIDIARLDYMRALVASGVASSEAARIARDSDPAAASLIPNAKPVRLRAVHEESSVVVGIDGEKGSIRAITKSAELLDAQACGAIIDRLIAKQGVSWTWERVLVPTLTALGRKWEETGGGIEVEHLLSEVIMSSLRKIVSHNENPTNARPIVLAAAPHELHTLPLHAIAAGLAEHGISSRLLGARTPGDSLASAVDRVGACAVVVWSQSLGTADMSVWDGLGRQRPAPLLMAGGPGWNGETPEGVVAKGDLASTLIALAAATGRA
ncbi:MAG: MerR family transcriptional regulator [Actinomycetes bacterium]